MAQSLPVPAYVLHLVCRRRDAHALTAEDIAAIEEGRTQPGIALEAFRAETA
jgi:hypothetical protein